MAKKKDKEDCGCMFSAAKLYDKDGTEIGITNYTREAIAYAMAHSERIFMAETASQMFGKETVYRSDILDAAMNKVKNKHNLGEFLFFWTGKPFVINK